MGIILKVSADGSEHTDAHGHSAERLLSVLSQEDALHGLTLGGLKRLMGLVAAHLQSFKEEAKLVWE